MKWSHTAKWVFSHHWMWWLVNTNILCSLGPGSWSSINGAWLSRRLLTCSFYGGKRLQQRALHFSTGDQTADFLEKAWRQNHRAESREHGAQSRWDGVPCTRWPLKSNHMYKPEKTFPENLGNFLKWNKNADLFKSLTDKGFHRFHCIYKRFKNR